MESHEVHKFYEEHKMKIGKEYRLEVLKMSKEDIYDYLDHKHQDNVHHWRTSLMESDSKYQKRMREIHKEYNIEIEKLRDSLKEARKFITETDPQDPILDNIDTALLIECETCNGKGEAVFSCCSGEVVDDDMMMCPTCHEHLGEEECQDCEGTGKVSEDKDDFTEKAPSMQAAAEAYGEARKYGEI